LTLVRGSYLGVPFDRGTYDYAVAVMTLHHLLPDMKRTLYQRIKRALRPGGSYIGGYWVVSPEEEAQYLSDYEEKRRDLAPAVEASYHIDVPLSSDTEKRLLSEAGFSSTEVIWRAKGNAVCVAHN
jgi:tRNA (cmo5U34)-methyltransferase